MKAFPPDRLPDRLRLIYGTFESCRDRCLPGVTEESVHDARIAANRLLAMLIFLKPWISSPERRTVIAGLRQFVGATSSLRDAQVRCNALAQESPASRFQSALIMAYRRQDEERACLRKWLLRGSCCVSRPMFESSFKLMLDDRDLGDVTAALIQARMTRQGLRLLKRVREADRREHFSHRLRLRVKKLRYAVEGYTIGEPAQIARVSRVLRFFQRDLGEFRDSRLLVKWLCAATGARRQELKKLYPINHINSKRVALRLAKSASQFRVSYRAGAGYRGERSKT